MANITKADGAGKSEEYVKRLCVATCTCGSMDYQYLNLPKDHGVYYQDTDHPLMNANDHHGNEHIMHFGRCRSNMNPNNAMSDVLGKVVPVVGLVNMAKDALDCQGCKCAPRTLRSWEKANKHNRLDGAPALVNTSELICMYGGVITITEIPQEPVKGEGKEEQMNMDDAKSTRQQEEKDVLDTLPSNMADKIRKINLSEETTEEISDTAAETMAEDTADWYADHADTFAQDYICTPQMSAQNYSYNSTQAITADCMNEDGFITNPEGLSNFNLAGTNAGAIGGGCAATYNVLWALGTPVGMAEIIQGMERQQTMVGFIDQGPMAVSMLSMTALLKGLGLEAEMSFRTKVTEETLKLEEGEVLVLGTSKKKIRKEKNLETQFVSRKRTDKRSVVKEEAFCTIKRNNSKLVCAELADKPIGEVLREKSENNMMLVKVKRKNKERMEKRNICEKINIR